MLWKTIKSDANIKNMMKDYETKRKHQKHDDYTTVGPKQQVDWWSALRNMGKHMK